MSAGELRRRTPRPVGVVLSENRVSAPLRKRHELLALLAKMQRNGEIGTAWTDVDESARTGEMVVYFERLREPRPKVPRYAAMMATGVGGMLTVGMMVWHARHVILIGLAILAGTAAAIVLLMYLLTHQPGCSGLHCPGCKG